MFVGLIKIMCLINGLSSKQQVAINAISKKETFAQDRK